MAIYNFYGSHPSVKLLKFADDTTLIGLISNGDEAAYRKEVDSLAFWCSQNHLELNACKTVEMVADLRRSPGPTIPLIMCDSPTNYHHLLLTDSSFKTEFLQSHNEYRAKHGVPDLAMSDELCRSAQAWADHLENINKNSSMMSLQHSDTKNGENLFFSSSSAPITLTGMAATHGYHREQERAGLISAHTDW
ncbi:uncharacterized protein im:7150988 [Clupea harengus]|uniref:Uncharacterized protein im:7150988 n=1 Tax=Clupea harengus TaxID=7950 RepID=A0A8M1KQD4_CLUHA|nr:uncharacterized protein im:7150988 [Clupea harengus]